MYFRVLGRLEIISGAGEQLQITRSAPRALLAALLLRAGKPYPSEMLTRALWANGQANDQAQQLRKAVWEARCALGGESARLITIDQGYQFYAQPSELDMLQFRASAKQGGQLLAAGDNEQAAIAYRQALSLWRNSALPVATEEADRLLEQRRAAHLSLATAMLALGRHRQILAGLRDFAADHPHCERGWVQLILALCQSGQNYCEALSTCDQALDALRAAHGKDSGGQVHELRQRILCGDPALATWPELFSRRLAFAADHWGAGH